MLVPIYISFIVLDQQRGLIHLGGNNVHSQRFGLFVEDANTA